MELSEEQKEKLKKQKDEILNKGMSPEETMRGLAAVTINIRALGREALEAVEDQKVLDSEEMQRDYVVKAFRAPYCVVQRKSDGKLGSLLFQHYPRFYWGFYSGEET